MRFRLGRRRRSGSLGNLLLETVPPVFHVTLTSLLTYLFLTLRPDDHYLRLVGLFFLFQMLANWVMFLLNQATVSVSPKNFPAYIHRYPSLTHARSHEGDQPTELHVAPEFERHLWRECESCDLHVPKRTHHCGHCRRCIYALDHHCYFLGACVGRHNLRFFLVFCWYAALGSALGVFNVFEALTFYRDPYSREAAYFVLPYTVVMYLLDRAAAFEMLYVALLNFGVGACLACLYLLVAGFYSAYTGKTPHEAGKRPKPEQLIYRWDDPELEVGCLGHLGQVFGPCGWLHFLVPIVPFDGPEPVVGYRRIITYNNDYILDGTVFTSEADLDFQPS